MGHVPGLSKSSIKRVPKYSFILYPVESLIELNGCMKSSLILVLEVTTVDFWAHNALWSEKAVTKGGVPAFIQNASDPLGFSYLLGHFINIKAGSCKACAQGGEREIRYCKGITLQVSQTKRKQTF